MTDKGTQFCDEFIEIAALLDINVDNTGIEAHNALGIASDITHHLETHTTNWRLIIPYKKSSAPATLSKSNERHIEAWMSRSKRTGFWSISKYQDAHKPEFAKGNVC